MGGAYHPGRAPLVARMIIARSSRESTTPASTAPTSRLPDDADGWLRGPPTRRPRSGQRDEHANLRRGQPGEQAFAVFPVSGPRGGARVDSQPELRPQRERGRLHDVRRRRRRARHDAPTHARRLHHARGHRNLGASRRRRTPDRLGPRRLRLRPRRDPADRRAAGHRHPPRHRHSAP